MRRVEQDDAEGQSAADDEKLHMAIRAIPLAILPWGPKVLLEQLVDLASQNGEPADHIATTQPQLGDQIGAAHITAGEFLDVLVRLQLVTIVKRLFRGERDRRAPYLTDGGSILRLERIEILKLAMRNKGPLGTRYRPVTEAALAVAYDRLAQLEEELGRLHAGQAEVAGKVDLVLAKLGLVASTASSVTTVEVATPKRRRRGGGGAEGQGGAQGGSGGARTGSKGSRDTSALGVLAPIPPLFVPSRTRRSPMLRLGAAKGQCDVQCSPQSAANDVEIAPISGAGLQKAA